MTENRSGRCFELAYDFIHAIDDGVLIHALVWSSHLKSMIGHAFVELNTDVIYEPVSDHLFRKAELYKRFKVKELARYSPTEARVNILKHKHFGPWDPQVLQKIHEAQKGVRHVHQKKL